MKTRFSNERGSTLIASLIMVVLLGYMGASVLEITSSDSGVGSNEIQSVQALQVGNGGIQYALDKIDQGQSPDVTDKSFGPGSFTVSSNPTTQKVDVTGRVGLARKQQSVTTTFAQQCADIDVTTASYNGKDLEGIEIYKNCNENVVVSTIEVEWNWSLCAQNLTCTATENPDPGEDPNTGKITLCHIPPGNHANMHTISVSQNALPAHQSHGGVSDTEGECDVSDPDTPIVCEGYDEQVVACGADTAGALVKSVRLDGSPVANNINKDSGETIDINDTIFSTNQAYVLDKITFDTNIPNNAWFAVTVNFADGSSIRKPFKFGTIAETTGEGSAFIVSNGTITVNPNSTIKLDVLGSALTCAASGATIPVKGDLGTNNVYHNMFSGNALVGGESVTWTTSSGDTFKVRANGKLTSCARFNNTYESTNAAQVQTLVNGDPIPTSLVPAGGTQAVQGFLAPYISGSSITLADNQVLMLFEIGTSSAAAMDYQDLVVLFTIDQ